MGFSKKKKACAVRHSKYYGLTQIMHYVLLTIWCVSLGKEKSVYCLVKIRLKQ